MALILSDFTSNGNTLTNSNCTESTSNLAYSSACPSFSAASSAQLSASDSVSLSQTGNMTIMFRVYFTSTPTSGNVMGLVNKWASPSDQDYRVVLFNDTGTLKLQAEISQTGSATFDGVRWNWTPSLNTWYRVAVTITPGNASATTFEAFIDGASQGNGVLFNSDNASSIHDGASTLYLGSTGSASYLDGKIDDVQIYSAVKTPTEISTNSSIRLIGNESNLVAYWPFDYLQSQSLIMGNL